ncbi:hypothetical protein L1987_19214 [Smallanthus sonchifolius]|uniref:Uncharacterized protein n=1 Tax=Smallanthus sonchifolius TaxID=185202 RepID=A0ACB9IN05_9ASTR|nr:hypothetical protein L1987_19214 [Smallanthus sonchifolius]
MKSINMKKEKKSVLEVVTFTAWTFYLRVKARGKGVDVYLLLEKCEVTGCEQSNQSSAPFGASTVDRFN